MRDKASLKEVKDKDKKEHDKLKLEVENLKAEKAEKHDQRDKMDVEIKKMNQYFSSANAL